MLKIRRIDFYVITIKNVDKFKFLSLTHDHQHSNWFFFLENLKRIKKLNIFSGPKQAYLSGKRWFEVPKRFHSN